MLIYEQQFIYIFFFLGKHCVYVIDAMIIGFKEDVLPVIVQIINRKVSDTDLNKKEIAIVLLGCVAESKGML